MFGKRNVRYIRNKYKAKKKKKEINVTVLANRAKKKVTQSLLYLSFGNVPPTVLRGISDEPFVGHRRRSFYPSKINIYYIRGGGGKGKKKEKKMKIISIHQNRLGTP
jgi:hypothetical protein